LGPDTDFIVVLTTFPVDGDEPAQTVEQLAKTLVEERLAGCVNILAPMRSIYSWKGQLETANERQLVIKTTRARLEELKSRLLALHPYDTPEFLVIPVADGSRDYLNWLAENTTK
jgi:periplasmic divalent cation tolerance protein